MNKYPIALISDHASPLCSLGGVDAGGQNVYVSELAQNLARQGWQVDVFTRRDSPQLPEIVHWKPGIRVIHVPAGPACLIPKEQLLTHMSDFTEFMGVFMLKSRLRYSVIHANFWMSGMVASELKQLFGIDFVITFHALGKVRRRMQGASDLFPDERVAIEQRLVGEADAIIAECPQDRTDLLELYQADPRKIVTIPCGFNPDEMRPVNKMYARWKTGLPQLEPVILQLGRLVPRKGVDNAILGFARLVHEHGTPARLVIVGGDTTIPDPVATPEIARLQEIARDAGVLDRVTFTGKRNRDQLRYYYSAADIFVTTPWYEPFGITPLEAMACGAVVIGANVGGIKSTVLDGVTGLLVPANDPATLGSRLKELVRDPARRAALAQKAQERALTLFKWSDVAQQMEKVYESLIPGSGYTPPVSVVSQITNPELEDRLVA